MTLDLVVPAAALAILLCGCSGNDQRPAGEARPSPTSSAPMPFIPVFDGNRAFRFLTQQTSFGPRNPNSRGHDECLQYLTATLKGYADSLTLQPFVHQGYGGENLRLTNIIARFRPDATSRILLCAHWDTRPRADRDENPAKRDTPIPGANDGASGVAVLLEIASLLHETPPPIGVDIVLFDGEDYGLEGDHANYLLGSRAFARSRSADYLPRFAILLDMVGDRFLDIPREAHSIRFAPDVVDLVWRTARSLNISQFIDEPGEEILDDHIPLNEVGIKAIDLIDFNYPDDTNRYWHTHQDIPDNCSAESLSAVGTVVTHVVYGLRP